MLIFNGRWVLCPPYILRPTTRLAYCTGIRRCPCSTKMMTPTTSHHDHRQNKNREDAHFILSDSRLKVLPMAPGSAGHDAGKDDQRDTVADTALGDLLTQPHDEGRTGGQGDDRHQAETPTGIEDHRLHR